MAPRLDWPSIIRRHFGQILRHRAEADDLMKRLESDFEEARPLLKVRLYPADTPLDPSAVQHPAEGLLAALVYDLPETVMSVSKDHIARWAIPADELFKIALENVRNEPGIQDELLEIPGRVSFHILNGSSFFTATERVGCDTKLASAARPKWRSRATATMYRSSVSVTACATASTAAPPRPSR